MRRLAAAMFLVCAAGACGGIIAARDDAPGPHGEGSGEAGVAVPTGSSRGVPVRDGGGGETGAPAVADVYTEGAILYTADQIPAFTLGPSDVFVVDDTSHQIVRVPKNGAPPVVLATRPPGTHIVDIAIDATNVYWSLTAGTGPVSNAIETVPIAGGDVTMLTERGFEMNSIAVDATGIYWTAQMAIMKSNLDGGDARVILSLAEYPDQLSVKGTRLCWASGRGGYPTDLSCSGREGGSVTIVWADRERITGSAMETNELLALEKIGEPNQYLLAVAPLPASLASAGAPSGGRARRVAFDDASFFVGWPNGVARFLRGSASIDVTPPTIATSTYGLDVAVDDTNVYWIEEDGIGPKTLRTLPK